MSGAGAAERQTVARIDKARGDQVHVALARFKGHTYADLRQFYDAGEGAMRPTGKGVTVPLAALDDLRDGIERLIALRDEADR